MWVSSEPFKESKSGHLPTHTEMSICICLSVFCFVLCYILQSDVSSIIYDIHHHKSIYRRMQPVTSQFLVLPSKQHTQNHRAQRRRSKGSSSVHHHTVIVSPLLFEKNTSNRSTQCISYPSGKE